MCTCGQTNDNDCASWSDIFSCLLEWLLVDSHKDDCMGTEAILGSSSDILGNIAGGSKVDECLLIIC